MAASEPVARDPANPEAERSAEEQVLGCLRNAGLRLPVPTAFEWRTGEIRLRGPDGVARVRIVPRARGGCHVDLDPQWGGLADASRASEALGAIESRQARRWIERAGPPSWQMPFDRGPGLYPFRELDVTGVASAVLGGLDVRIAYVEASCSADCVFCGHLDSLSDGVAERLTLEAVRAGTIDVGGAWVCLGGPEPTENVLLDDYLRALRAGGASKIAMIATAEALAPPGRAAALRASGLDTLSLPIYGASPRVHDAVVRRPGAHGILLRTIEAARAAGLDVYLHTLALAQNASELPALAAWARQTRLPLAAGLPRRKGDLAGYNPTGGQLDSVCKALPVIGAPRCLTDSPAAVPADAAEALGRFGPMLVYFALQAGDWGAPCGECGVRSRCWGVPRGTLEVWGPLLAPVRA